MPIVAVPDYLGKLDLTSASPGLRFGMYLPLWGKNNRSGELLWSIKDINYRVTGKDKQERKFEDDNKRGALQQTLHLHRFDTDAMGALVNRQTACAAAISPDDQLFILDAESIAPFTTGLGNEHPLENGFAFLNPYGLPYLPGSGVKGVLRQAARELAGVSKQAQWDIDSDWTEDYIAILFGREDSNDACRGVLTFWDVIPQISGNSLMVEVMTAHQSHYYQKDDTPHESGQPTPINFLTVPPDSGFTFHVLCDRPFLGRIAPELAEGDHWKTLLAQAFEHAFNWLGFGAKTAVGYGAIKRNLDAEEHRRIEEKQRQEQRKKEDTLAAITANLPEDAVWIETHRRSGAWSDVNTFLDLVESFLQERKGLSVEAYQRLSEDMNQRWKGIMDNPDAVQGKKQKPKFKPRPRDIAKRLS